LKDLQGLSSVHLPVFGLMVASYYKITEKKSRRDLWGIDMGTTSHLTLFGIP
jgi:hypothetical protein